MRRFKQFIDVVSTKLIHFFKDNDAVEWHAKRPVWPLPTFASLSNAYHSLVEAGRC